MNDVMTFKVTLLFTVRVVSASAISGCAATNQAGRYANAGCDPSACAPAVPASHSRYGAPVAQDCCFAPPPIMYVDRIKTVQVEKPVYVDREKIVEVEKPVYIEKEVFIEVPAEPVICCTYPAPPVPAQPHYPKRK